MTAECPHLDFRADVNVGRIEDVGAFVADVRITCTVCGTPFAFIGLQAGVQPDRPTVSWDNLELRAPIQPQGSTHVPRYPGFSIREVKQP